MGPEMAIPIGGRGPEAPPARQGGALAPVGREVRALAVAIVPRAAALDEEGWRALEALVEEALATRPESMKRQLRLFVRAISWLPVLRHGRTLGSLDPRRRDAYLRSVERSRLLLVRRGFWGLRTLVLLGYWGRPEAGEAIGYRAHPGGWGARR